MQSKSRFGKCGPEKKKTVNHRHFLYRKRLRKYIKIVRWGFSSEVSCSSTTQHRTKPKKSKTTLKLCPSSFTVSFSPICLVFVLWLRSMFNEALSSSAAPMKRKGGWILVTYSIFFRVCIMFLLMFEVLSGKQVFSQQREMIYLGWIYEFCIVSQWAGNINTIVKTILNYFKYTEVLKANLGLTCTHELWIPCVCFVYPVSHLKWTEGRPSLQSWWKTKKELKELTVGLQQAHALTVSTWWDCCSVIHCCCVLYRINCSLIMCRLQSKKELTKP